jgi:hypothetical protein
VLDKSQVGFVRSRGFDQLHHGERRVDCGFFQISVHDSPLARCNWLGCGQGLEQVFSRPGEIPFRLGPGDHDRKRSAVLNDRPIVANVIALRRIELDGIAIHAENLVTAWHGQLSLGVDYEAPSARQELFLASFDHKETVIVGDGEVGFVTGLFKGAKLKDGFRGLYLGATTDIGQRTRSMALLCLAWTTAKLGLNPGVLMLARLCARTSRR